MTQSKMHDNVYIRWSNFYTFSFWVSPFALKTRIIKVYYSENIL
jgi:hypothetical protein